MRRLLWLLLLILTAPAGGIATFNQVAGGVGFLFLELRGFASDQLLHLAQAELQLRLLLERNLQLAGDLRISCGKPTLLSNEVFAMRVETHDLVVGLGALAGQVVVTGLFGFEDGFGLGEVAGQDAFALIQLFRCKTISSRWISSGRPK